MLHFKLIRALTMSAANEAHTQKQELKCQLIEVRGRIVEVEARKVISKMIQSQQQSRLKSKHLSKQMFQAADVFKA